MDLENFISKVLISIKSGLHSANEALGKDTEPTFLIGVDGSERICFDIAVTISTKNEKEGAGEIKVISLGASGNFNKTEVQEYVSRIKFSVHSRGTE